jgi:hypothetical protein
MSENLQIEATVIPLDMSIEALTSLTSKDRILLYLSDFSHLEERYELPGEIVQESISFAAGVQRKHLSQYLDDLIGEGFVTERKAHIKGMKQRMNGYYLTTSGYSKSGAIRDQIKSVVVSIRVNGNVVDKKVCEIDDMTPARVTFCDIVREAIQHGRLDLEELNNVDARKRELIEVEDQASQAYKRALQTVWRDGVVTATERFLVEELRKHLKISDDQHRALEEMILKKLAQTHMEFLRIYRSVLEVALADGAFSGPEVEISESLRRTFRISHQEHDELLREVSFEMSGPRCSDGPDDDSEH